MKITFILKDLSDYFYNGGTYSIGLNNLDPLQQFLYLHYLSVRKELYIKMKIASGQFRDAVEFNSMRKKGLNIGSAKLESRRGYKLMTFEFL